MRKTGRRWWLRDRHELNGFVEHIEQQWLAGNKPVVCFVEQSQTMSQNAMEHALYREIAAQLEDKTMLEVKAECKLRYGVALLKGSDPEWAAWYDRTIKPMKYEDKLFLMQEYPITSLFTVEQGSQYIDQVINDYGRQGIWLQHPGRHDPTQGN